MASDSLPVGTETLSNCNCFAGTLELQLRGSRAFGAQIASNLSRRSHVKHCCLAILSSACPPAASGDFYELLTNPGGCATITPVSLSTQPAGPLLVSFWPLLVSSTCPARQDTAGGAIIQIGDAQKRAWSAREEPAGA